MATPEVDPCVGEYQWPELDSITRNIQLVPEDVLLRITRGPLAKFIQGCEDSQQVNCVWQSILQTFSTRSIPSSQTTASCNAITVFLDVSSSCGNATTREFGLSHETWLAVFEIYLLRHEDSTPKPMKQVLSGLAELHKRHGDSGEAELTRRNIIAATMPSIMLADSPSRLKASTTALERLIVENAISAYQLMYYFHDWLVTHHERWQPLFESHCVALSIDTTQFIEPSVKYDQCSEKVKQDVSMIFNLGLLIHATNQAYASVAAGLMTRFSEKTFQEGGNTNSHSRLAGSVSKSWVKPTRYIISQSMGSLEHMSRTILHSLVAADIGAFRAFVSHLPLQAVLSGDMDGGTVDEFILLFSVLNIAKKAGFVHEDHIYKKTMSTTKDHDDILILNSEVLGQFVLHKEQTIRIAALSLLIIGPATTKPFSAAALKTIMNGLPSMHADSNAQTRQQIVTLVKKLAVRLRGSQAQMNLDNGEAPHAQKFLETYRDFLEDELRPSASYQRHITALKSLSIILNTGVDPRVTRAVENPNRDAPWRFTVDILRRSLFRLLVDLLLDPFDEVRGSALHILGVFPAEIPSQLSDKTGNNSSNVIEWLLIGVAKAKVLASNTSRADHADTLARLYHAIFLKANTGERELLWYRTKIGVVNGILDGLEAKLVQPGGLFSSSTRDAPLHGYVSALRYIVATPDFFTLLDDSQEKTVAEWRKVQDRIGAACNKIWHEVKPMLCIDSPEGHTDEAMDDLMVGPKDVLSYSWRALRESSLLLQAILANTTYGPQDRETGLQRKDYEAVAQLSFIQLSELRHRGAFTAVSQTFATCCLRCSENSDPDISSLPEAWYQISLTIIENQASKLTRRSAGLPALITGLLLSSVQKPLFHQVISDVLEISRRPAESKDNYSELSLPQVHAMNCLKDALANSRLAPYIESFIMPALKLSADSLGSPIWAIRNCGLMLFRVLMTRMCRLLPGTTYGFAGASGSDGGMKISFQKYPELEQLLYDLLTSADQARHSQKDSAASETEKVFPVLEILAEKIPSTDDDDIQMRELVLQQRKSTIWAVRDHSARVYASLLRPSQILESVQTLLKVDEDIVSQNQLHGRILCIRYSLRRVWFSGHSKVNRNGIFAIIRDTFASFYLQARSPFVMAALVDVMTDALESSIGHRNDGEMIDFANEIFKAYDLDIGLANLLNQPETHSGDIRADSLLRRSLGWSMILKIIMEEVAETPLRLIDIFFDISTIDSDAACWILHRMETAFTGYENQKDFLSLYLLIILRDQGEGIKAAVALNLSKALEDALDNDLPVVLQDKWARVADHLFAQSQEQIWGRHMVENVLRLQGCLMAVTYSESLRSRPAKLELEIRRWALSLRSALSEEMAFSTRYAAVMSLKSFSHILRESDHVSETNPVLLELYLILYDMLTDDDDELRDLAATIASWILSCSPVSLGKTVALAAVPACEALADFLAKNYSTSSYLFQDAINRVTGASLYGHKLCQKDRLVAFENSLAEYRMESTVLFEEERQNLFIDDVREIDIWMRVLISLDTTTYDSQMVNCLFDWTCLGLEHLIGLASSGDHDDMLGWTSKPEVYTLGVRLFSLSSLLISRDLQLESPKLGTKAKLSEKLRTLLDKSPAISLHPHWLRRIDTALLS